MTGLTPDITDVSVLRHGVLRLTFADGVTGEVNVLDRMRGPLFECALTPEGFAAVTVDAETGTICWPGGSDPLGRVEFVRVTSVDVLGHYRLALGFCDGSKRDVDLTGELHGPVFEPLADPGYFAQMRVDDQLGTVVWPNGADLDPLVLHGDFESASPLVHN